MSSARRGGHPIGHVEGEELTMSGVGIRMRRGEERRTEVRVADEVRDQIGSEKREVNSNCADNTKDDAERVDKDLNFER